MNAICVACHAVPSDPLYAYLPEHVSITLWESELNSVNYPDFLFVGHTHMPTKTQFRRTLIVNPGSVGQPKDGDPRAAYAIWEDGKVSLRRAEYDVEQTVRAYRGTRLEPQTVDVLAEVLRTGGHLLMGQNPYEQFNAYFQKHPDKLAGLFYLQKLLNQRIGVDTDRMTEAERPAVDSQLLPRDGPGIGGVGGLRPVEMVGKLPEIQQTKRARGNRGPAAFPHFTRAGDGDYAGRIV